MAAADVAVDLGYLSAHLGVPETTLSTVATDPTVELVKAVLQAVTVKAQEYDTLYAEKLQVDIELENAIRSSEARCQTFKSTADKALKEVEDLRRKLQDEEASRQALESQLQSVKSSTTTSLSEIETLRARISSLETSNRETLAIVESKTTANAELSEELQKQHQKNVKLSQDIAALQQSVQAAQAAASSAKWRTQNLEQELALARKNNEWLENELKTKSEEARKFRTEKSARISELQRLNEEANSTIDSLTRGEQQLRSRLDEAQKKADDALTKVQQLQEAAARTEESFRQELESLKRLVELKEQQTETHRNRLREVETRLEQVKDDDDAQLRRVRQELEQERSDHEQAIRQVQDLETEVDRLQAMLSTQGQPGSAPQTPRPNGSLLAARAGSPFGPATPMRGKASISATQAIEELYKVKGELAGERRRNERLSQELDEMMNALEAKGPEVNELQAEAERLRNENIQMTQLADESYKERDLAKKAARKAETAANTAQAEIKILRAQLRDLSTQIQMLVFNMHAQEKGLDELTEEEAIQYAQLQNGQSGQTSLDDLSETHRFISEKLVVFKDIYELQEKNQELLRITRELAEKMESEEALAAQRQAAQDQQEVLNLRETVSRLQDEVKSMTIRMKSHMQERDMFRRLLQQKASAAEINSVLGGTLDGSHREVLASIEQTSTIDESEVTTALRELQNNFDAYRNEQSADVKTMREQIEKLSSDKNALNAEIAKVRSQLTLSYARHEMLQSNYAALQNENKELQKRSQTISETAAKQDIRTQQLATDLVEARQLIDSLNSKKANLEAEKALWADIRNRLSQDNDALSQEKARLSTLLTQQQNLLNERELNENESKRRLQSQIDTLEIELKTTKRKLSEEVEEAKKAQLRKEFDTQQAQKRIDDLVANLGQVKEELTAAKTSRDHLQARVEELTVELRSAQEKAERLQPRPTPRPGTANEEASAGEDAEAQIQDLNNEVADLKRDLELATAHLENAKAQAEQYKELSQAAEEELTSLNATQEQFREEMEASLASKDVQIKELQQRVEDLSTELANSNNQLSSLRDSQAEVARKFEDEKRILNEEVERLKDEEERYKEMAKYHQQDLRAQADIATKAQQDYEQELVKHAEAARSLQSLRAEYAEIKSESSTLKAEAESAKHTLEESKRSWTEREEQLQNEIHELRERRKSADEQNKTLQEQLDKVSAQIATLQQSRASLVDAAEGSPVVTTDSAADGLRELNTYLRREKEILEVQYDLKVQESKRLQQQLDIRQSQLDEAQLKLEQERAAASEAKSSTTHQDLLNKLNELNMIRESNVTLRNENHYLQAQLTERNTKISELEDKIQPLETRISELENQKVFLEEEIKQLQEDRDRWQKRTEGILSKYGRVDPAELEQIKQTVSTLEAERDRLKEAEEPLKAKIQELEASLDSERTTWNDSRQKLISQAKEKARQQNTTIKELTQQKSELQQQLESVSQELSSCKTNLQTALQEKSSLEEEKRKLQEQLESAPVNSEASAAPAIGDSPETAARLAQLEQELETTRQELSSAVEWKASAEQELESLQTQLASAVDERDKAVSQLQQSSENASSAPLQNGASHPAPEALSDTERAALETRVAAAEAKVVELQAKVQEAEARSQEAEVKAKETLDTRSSKMRETFNKKLKETRENLEKEFEQSKTQLTSDFELRLQQERAIWEGESKGAVTVADQSANVSTPSKQVVDGQPPQTPTTGLAAMIMADFAKLNDTEIRGLLSKNSTLKTILANNLKKKLADETKKVKEEAEQAIKTEWESKVASAREQATLMESKKSSLRINMAENKVKAANAKLGVVETAAKETPDRPVGEVWNIAKDAKPTPTVQPQPAAAPSPAATAIPSANATGTRASPAAAVSSPQNTENAKGQAPLSSIPLPGKPTPAVAQQGTAPPTTAKPLVNPFAQSSQPGVQAALPNPFIQNAGTVQPQQGQQQGQQASQARTTGIPVPANKGGGQARGGRGGVYQHPRGGRGGQAGQNRNASGGGLNPGADNFQPGGNKRPRDSEAGTGQSEPKRMRGGRGGGTHRGS